MNHIALFQLKQPKGIIGVWWLYDDGGLTLLLPHIMSTRSSWSSFKFRIFCTGQEELEKEHWAYVLVQHPSQVFSFLNFFDL